MINRTKSNWAFGEKLTSAQINALDTNVTYALDKRSGQTDTLQSNVTVTGATTFSGTIAISNTTTVTGNIVTSGNITTTGGLIFSGGSTVSGVMDMLGTFVLDSTGVFNALNGSLIDIQTGSTLQLNSGAVLSLASGSTISNTSTETFNSGGSLSFNSGSSQTFNSGTTETFASGSNLTFSLGSTITNTSVETITNGGELLFASGSTLKANSGSNLTLDVAGLLNYTSATSKTIYFGSEQLYGVYGSLSSGVINSSYWSIVDPSTYNSRALESAATGNYFALAVPQLPVGAVITGISMFYRTVALAAGTVQFPINFRVYKSNFNNKETVSSSLYSGGIVAPSGVASTYYNSGNPQTLTMTPDQNNSISAADVINITVQSEHGTNSVTTNNVVNGFSLTYTITNIA